MPQTTWVWYIALCIVVPMAWGLVTEWVFGRAQGYLQKRRRPAPDRAQSPVARNPRTPETLDYRI
jgi:hypothetical protein